MITRRKSGRAPRWAAIAGVLALAGMPSLAAADNVQFVITVRNGRFSPTEVTVPAGREVVLIVDNVGDAIEEFESYDLDREKVVAPKSRATISVGPLKAGRYEFINEFNKKAPPGAVIAE